MTQHSVYTFYGPDGVCLYVGCTSDFGRRYRDHQTQREWFPEVTRFEVVIYPDCVSGTAAEAARIREANPVHNRALTDHDTPRRQPCRHCRAAKHPLCNGMRGDMKCYCKVCAAREKAA